MNNYLHGRTPIPKGGTIKLDNHEYLYENMDSPDMVSAGSTCLVYHVLANTPDGTHYFMLKEFYPILEKGMISRHPVTNKLIVDETTKQSTEYQTRLKQFMQSVKHSRTLSDVDLSIVIPHNRDDSAGDSYYIITDYTRAMDLKKNEHLFRTFLGKTIYIESIFRPFSILEQNGLLLLDIKPENLLYSSYSYNEHTMIIADTDSLYTKGEPMNDILLLSNVRYAAPEVKNLQLFSSETAYEIASDILTPYATMYSIGKYLFEYFWEEPFIKKNLYDYDTDYLLDKFVELYYDPSVTEHVQEYTEALREAGLELIDTLDAVLIEDLTERMTVAYKDIFEFDFQFNGLFFYYLQLKYKALGYDAKFLSAESPEEKEMELYHHGPRNWHSIKGLFIDYMNDSK
ncbi:MAG: hypothetical protein E7253_00935 [Lachnospiraceae bacterium]|nr:hypothetical protein [Lachnospiraceae bacterium]